MKGPGRRPLRMLETHDHRRTHGAGQNATQKSNFFEVWAAPHGDGQTNRTKKQRSSENLHKID